MKISVVINTYNAERHLERVLETVKEFDEILICDMYSSDKTVEIASRYNCKMIYHEHTGVVEPARVFAISQSAHEWVFVVDADELVPDALREYLYNHIKKENPEDALYVNRRNYKLGRFMKCAYPDSLLRFFRKDRFVDWPSRIHSTAVINGSIGYISPKQKDLAFVHLCNETISETITKTNIYTDKERIRRQARNYGWFALIFHPMVRFFRFYISKGGFRDGKAGFIWAVESAHYKFITIAKVIESKIVPERDWDENLKP